MLWLPLMQWNIERKIEVFNQSVLISADSIS